MKRRGAWSQSEARPCPADSRWHGARRRPPWRGRGRFLFLRFAGVFGLIALLVFGWLAALGVFLARLVGGSIPAPLVVFLACGLLLALPLLALHTGRRAFRGIALPLADLMSAADAVAQGDLSVRVPLSGPGPFARLAASFNHMTAELARADQQRRNLTADIAHELRTPLHIIQGNLEGILDGVYEPTPEHITATLSETRALARLVEDLRTLTLAEAGQLPLAREPVDIADLLADIGTSFSGQAEAAGVALRVESGADLAAVRVIGDAGRLDQVLTNLVANALRHTPAGGVVTLRAEPLDAGVRILVRDTGAGIAPDDLPYIFDRFWRGDPARAHTGGAGSGLGLAIARQLVQAHGGQISVTSQVGVGTEFTLDLPSGAANGRRDE